MSDRAGGVARAECMMHVKFEEQKVFLYRLPVQQSLPVTRPGKSFQMSQAMSQYVYHVQDPAQS